MLVCLFLAKASRLWLILRYRCKHLETVVCHRLHLYGCWIYGVTSLDAYVLGTRSRCFEYTSNKNHFKGRNQALASRLELTMDWLALIAGIIGGISLILLAGFDTQRYPTLHRLFLLLFMLGMAPDFVRQKIMAKANMHDW
jgi:hypothetical protein